MDSSEPAAAPEGRHEGVSRSTLTAGGVNARGARLPSRRGDAVQGGAILVVLAALLLYGLLGSRTQLAIDIAMFVALAYSWNVISGFTGYVSFGQVLFFGLGALITAELIIRASVPWLLAAVLAGVAAGLIAIPIGIVMLRLRGIYFALGMFGLVYIVSLLASQWSFTGGSTGLIIPGTSATNLVLTTVVAIAALAFALNAFMARSAFGLQAKAIRDDEQVAQAMGVATTRVKVTAFALSAVLPAAVGGVIAYNRAFIDHSTVFDSSMDLQVIVFVLAGGIGTLWGPLVGAVVLTVASDQLSKAMPDYQLALFGLLVILVTILMPGGVVSALNRFGWLRRDIVKGTQPLSAKTDLEATLFGTPRAESRDDRKSEELLACRGVDVKFGGVHALRGVDFTVRTGDTLFIIGANGAGKTTLFNAITGIVRPSAGSIVFDGVPIDRLRPHQLAQQGLGRTFQIPRPFESMTVWENVLLAAYGGRRSKRAVQQAAWVVHVLGLGDICFSPTETLAVGHRRMVELARALALAPRLILLDEVMAGMSDEELETVRDAIRRMPSFGVDAVAGIEHVIKAIMDLATEITVLDNGEKILTGEPREILSHPEVVRAYLGGPVNQDAGA